MKYLRVFNISNLRSSHILHLAVRRTLILCAVALLYSVSTSLLYGESAKNADSAFLKGDYQAAVKGYQAAIKKNPSALLYFKLGNSYYKLGKYRNAADVYKKAAEGNVSKEFLVKICYNMGNSCYKLSEAAEELPEKADFLTEAVELYRKALYSSQDMKDAGFNLELSMRKYKEVCDDMEKQDREQEEMQKALKEISDKLKALIRDQQENINATDTVIKNGESGNLKRKDVSDSEKSIKKGTEDVTGDAKRFGDTYFEGMPEDIMPVGSTIKSLNSAITHEDSALKELETGALNPASEEEKLALKALEQALASLPAQNQNKQGEQEQSENSDDDSQEADSETEEESENDSSSSSSEAKVNLDQRDLPPPNESPEDILKHDEEIQKIREQNAKGKKRKPVKMDW